MNNVHLNLFTKFVNERAALFWLYSFIDLNEACRVEGRRDELELRGTHELGLLSNDDGVLKNEAKKTIVNLSWWGEFLKACSYSLTSVANIARNCVASRRVSTTLKQKSCVHLGIKSCHCVHHSVCAHWANFSLTFVTQSSVWSWSISPPVQASSIFPADTYVQRYLRVLSLITIAAYVKPLHFLTSFRRVVECCRDICSLKRDSQCLITVKVRASSLLCRCHTRPNPLRIPSGSPWS